MRFLDRWAGIPLCLATSLLRMPKNHRPPPDKGRAAILCLGAIGDLLLLSALTNSLRQKCKGLKIDLIVSRANQEAAALLPGISQARAFPVTRPDRIISYLRRQKYDVLIDSSQWARIGALISNLSGAALTAGFKSAGQARHFGYDRAAWHSAARHEKDNFLELGGCVWGALDGNCGLLAPSGPPPPMLADGKDCLCLHMFPSGVKSRLKEWPEERWAELGKRLLGAGYRLLLTGSKADAPRAEGLIKKYFKRADDIHSSAGALSLEETARALRAAKALISVNTGIMHLGAILGVPTIGLHGPTNPARWGPLGEKTIALLPGGEGGAYLNFGWEYPANAKNTLGNISADEVIRALRELGIRL